MPGQDMHRSRYPDPARINLVQQGTGWTCAIGDTDSWALARIWRSFSMSVAQPNVLAGICCDTRCCRAQER